jgi:hypothetical protein
MNIGFTGTQRGMSPAQIVALTDMLRARFKEGNKFHHGDCIGADQQASEIARTIGYEIHCHPPVNESKRAFTEYDAVYEAEDYLIRNANIVHSADALIGTPNNFKNVTKSGTWWTIRRAMKAHLPIHIIYPDGRRIEGWP